MSVSYECVKVRFLKLCLNYYLYAETPLGSGIHSVQHSLTAVYLQDIHRLIEY